MIDKLIIYCINHNIPYEHGRNMCYCVDYNEFVNVFLDGEWHTLYKLDNGDYRYDETIKGLLYGEKSI